jgi:hypothetical protein
VAVLLPPPPPRACSDTEKAFTLIEPMQSRSPYREAGTISDNSDGNKRRMVLWLFIVWPISYYYIL